MGRKTKASKRQAPTLGSLKFVLLLICVGTLFGVGLSYSYQFVNGQSVEPIAAQTEATFVNNQTCASCHSDQYAHWQGSHHEQAMQPASADTVLANFDNTSYTDSGVTSRFFEQDGRYFVNTIGPDDAYDDFEVAYTFGVEPLQQYLLQFPNGKLQAFTVAWDVAQESWYSLYPDEVITPKDALHWTSDGFTANSSCIDCHTTNMTLNYDVESDTYETAWDEVNVSCQACHGPGSDHVTWAQDDGGGDSAENKGLVIDYAALDNVGQAETCARCHSRRYPITEDDTYGLTFLDDFMPELMRNDLYHPDGQILDEVYVYGSFTQSKMYEAGVSCTDCHNPHTAELQMPVEQLCISCHTETPPTERFPSLQSKLYDSPDHHFHEVGSEGAQCISCHMAEETYMLIDPRHDHSFPIPRPDLTAEWGTPNTCNSCHVEDSAESLANTMDNWYGIGWRDRPTIASTIALGRVAAPAAKIPLSEIINDQAQPELIRATALDLMRPYGSDGLTAMITTLDDESALVRATSLTGLQNVPETQIVQVVAPSLTDPVRAVRIAAAQALVGTPRINFNDAQWDNFQVALAEYIEAQLALADHPEGHTNLGSLYEIQGNRELAEKSYRTAIEKDPLFVPAYQSLALFYYNADQIQETEEAFRMGIARVDNPGSLQYSLGLFLVEQQRPIEAVETMGQAAALMPNNPRIQYNYGLLLQESEKYLLAEQAFLRAHSIASSDQNTLFALATVYRQLWQPDEALVYAKKLNELYPNDAKFIKLLDEIQQR